MNPYLPSDNSGEAFVAAVSPGKKSLLLLKWLLKSMTKAVVGKALYNTYSRHRSDYTPSVSDYAKYLWDYCFQPVEPTVCSANQEIEDAILAPRYHLTLSNS